MLEVHTEHHGDGKYILPVRNRIRQGRRPWSQRHRDAKEFNKSINGMGCEIKRA